MKRILSTTTIATTAILATLVGGSVLAATQAGPSSDEEALAPARPPASRGVEQKVDVLLQKARRRRPTRARAATAPRPTVRRRAPTR